MNKERLHQLADHLEKQIRDVNFGMAVYWFVEPTPNYCGSPACIAGYAVHLFGDPAKIKAISGTYFRVGVYKGIQSWTFAYAKELLGLDDEMARDLFTPIDGINSTDISKRDAAKSLRALADRGTFCW